MKRLQHVVGALAASALLLAPAAAFARAKIVINNQNAAGEGFNDPTPATPIGGNPGTTVGQQRLIAFQFAASIWGATITSSQTIVIDAKFSALECGATSAVLGSAGPEGHEAGDSSFPDRTVWYPSALANALANHDFDATGGDINANFNENLGQANCLPGEGWYYGLDGKPGAGQSDLPTVLLHEFSHGLGFLTYADQTGHNDRDTPDIFEKYAYDNSVNKSWQDMTDAERAASTLRPGEVVWSGSNVKARAPSVLTFPKVFGITQPAPSAEDFAYVGAEFGPQADVGFSGEVALVQSSSGSATDACSAVTGVSGKIALVDRVKTQGTCTFKAKAANVQAAGAVGMVVADYADDASPPGGMADDEGVTTSITIPSVFVSNDAGNAIRAALGAGATTVGIHLGAQRSGADADNQPFLYTPAKYETGSSVSHWSLDAAPSLLMEPYIHSDIPLGLDLTPTFMKDIGWTLGSDVTLAVAKADSDNIWPGGKAQYIVTVLNHGAVDDTNVVINGDTPTGFTLDSVTGAGCSTLPCSVGTVAADSRATVVVTFNVPLDYTSPDPAVEHLSFTSTLASAPDNAVAFTSPVQQSADLIVTSDAPSSVDSGEPSIDVKVTNSGPSVAKNVQVTIDSATNADLTGFTGDCSGANCHFDSVNPGETKTVKLQLKVSGKSASFLVKAAADTFDPYVSNSQVKVKFDITGGGCSASGGGSVLTLLLLAGAFLLRRRKVHG